VMAELIEPGSILDMTQDDLEALISTIRERRNRVIKARSVAHHRARATGVLSLRPKLEKLALRLDKIINKLDADLARAERLVREVTAMRLELGDATPSELAEELRAAGTRNVSHGGDDDDDVSGSQEQDGEDQVSGSQERPQPGVEPSPSRNPYWTDEEVTDESL
jgi:CRP-like cAMP-binding protein